MRLMLFLCACMIVTQGCISSNIDKLQKQTIMAQVDPITTSHRGLTMVLDINIKRYNEALELYEKTLYNVYTAEHYRLLKEVKDKKGMVIYGEVRRSSLQARKNIMNNFRKDKNAIISSVKKLKKEDLTRQQDENITSFVTRVWGKITDKVKLSTVDTTKLQEQLSFVSKLTITDKNFDIQLISDFYNTTFSSIPGLTNGGNVLKMAIYIEKANEIKANIQQGEEAILRAVEVIASYLAPDEEIDVEALVNLANTVYKVYDQIKNEEEEGENS
ncbi:hypothetical protein [Candidatus Uabimicrobium amorphum]|uniref:Lipoprotein n=1 Tax=Uabimicrobium amorphum TaxID=2596890 RepID=A0A5S9IRH9_UABAM|nr:hypothetical protein [Candidatus Uabimicrobium amorphum]BBM86230.1 hypothetical protein UABAM_04616 [Candidatus Uabimicrobium amorphum]